MGTKATRQADKIARAQARDAERDADRARLRSGGLPSGAVQREAAAPETAPVELPAPEQQPRTSARPRRLPGFRTVLALSLLTATSR